MIECIASRMPTIDHGRNESEDTHSCIFFHSAGLHMGDVCGRLNKLVLDREWFIMQHRVAMKKKINQNYLLCCAFFFMIECNHVQLLYTCPLTRIDQQEDMHSHIFFYSALLFQNLHPLHNPPVLPIFLDENFSVHARQAFAKLSSL